MSRSSCGCLRLSCSGVFYPVVIRRLQGFLLLQHQAETSPGLCQGIFTEDRERQIAMDLNTLDQLGTIIRNILFWRMLYPLIWDMLVPRWGITAEYLSKKRRRHFWKHSTTKSTKLCSRRHTNASFLEMPDCQKIMKRSEPSSDPCGTPALAHRFMWNILPERQIESGLPVPSWPSCHVESNTCP